MVALYPVISDGKASHLFDHTSAPKLFYACMHTPVTDKLHRGGGSLACLHGSLYVAVYRHVSAEGPGGINIDGS
jgi:hypothetical protein